MFGELVRSSRYWWCTLAPVDDEHRDVDLTPRVNREGLARQRVAHHGMVGRQGVGNRLEVLPEWCEVHERDDWCGCSHSPCHEVVGGLRSFAGVDETRELGTEVVG